MKQNKNQLDVDFIGGSGPLTKEEQQVISEFIKASRAGRQKQTSQPKARTVNKSIAASRA